MISSFHFIDFSFYLLPAVITDAVSDAVFRRDISLQRFEADKFTAPGTNDHQSHDNLLLK